MALEFCNENNSSVKEKHQPAVLMMPMVFGHAQIKKAVVLLTGCPHMSPSYSILKALRSSRRRMLNEKMMMMTHLLFRAV